MKKNTKPLWIIISILCAIICIGCVIYFATSFMSSNSSSTYKQPEVTTEATSTEETTVKLADNPVDWEELQTTNEDAYAWITIPKTKVDYVVLQSGKDKDDFFYLNHDINGNYKFAGEIYSEKQNAKDFSDPVTILYGHNMLNGDMFATLHKFEDSKFFNKNEYMYVYTPGRKLTYRIYAAYTYDDRHILNSFDFKDVKIRKKYFKSTLNPKSMTCNVRSDVKLTKNSKILTLSTCNRDSDNTRYLVQGVLIKDEPTN